MKYCVKLAGWGGEEERQTDRQTENTNVLHGSFWVMWLRTDCVFLVIFTCIFQMNYNELLFL